MGGGNEENEKPNQGVTGEKKSWDTLVFSTVLQSYYCTRTTVYMYYDFKICRNPNGV
jgi:hypothetical protein